VIGQEISNHLGAIPGTGLALFFSILFLVYGTRGLGRVMQNAICTIWDVKREDRPAFPWSLGYNLLLTLTVGSGFILTTFLSGLAGGAGHWLTGVGALVGAIIISFVLNVAMFWTSFRLASARKVPWGELKYGAITAAIVWQVLQLAGGYIITHQLHRSSELYGTFGVVLGLMAWIFLQAEATLYAAQIDVVLVRRLWPRSLKSDTGKQPRVPGQRSDSDRVGSADDSKSSGTKAA
jgi:uncharacterized BrkB/YihY/UPF0761 family membrane protein